MELWIRSQDRKVFTPISEELQVKRLNYVETPEERYFVLYKKLDLGSYKTEKRALEVLDEIQNLMVSTYIVDFNSIMHQYDIANVIKRLNKRYKANFIESTPVAKITPINPTVIIYEMPEE